MKALNTACVVLALAFPFVFTGCGVSSSDRQGPPETFSPLEAEMNQATPLPEPKVNILFVVDNSGSMKDYQTKMAENIALFADTFLDNTRLNYRIGIVPVYDSKYLNDKTVYVPSGLRKMNPLGELVPLKDANGKEIPGQVYITRDTPNPKETLKNTVMIGVQWGPEAEESFSPVLAVMDEKHNLSKNKGFYDKEAYLAVVFLTDADDVTPSLSAEAFFQKLVDLKDGDASKVLIAAALPNPKDNRKSCGKDGKGPIQAFPSLLAISGGIRADLCSDDFGADLAAFGNLLVQRVATQKLALNYTPDVTTMKVNYGTEADPKIKELEPLKDYLFNPTTNEIILSPKLKLPRVEGATIRISAKPVSLGNYKNGRLEELSRRRR